MVNPRVFWSIRGEGIKKLGGYKNPKTRERGDQANDLRRRTKSCTSFGGE